MRGKSSNSSRPSGSRGVHRSSIAPTQELCEPHIALPRMMPWSSDRINVAEVRRRLHMMRNLSAELTLGFVLGISIARRWYLRTSYPQVLEPRTCYVVAAYRDVLNSTRVEANVMRFITHVPVSAERAAVVDEWLAARHAIRVAERARDNDDDDDDDDVYEDDNDAREEDLGMCAKLLHVFEDLATGRRFTIDVFGWDIDRRDGVHIAVMDVTSFGWGVRRDVDEGRAVKSMDSIRRGWELGVVAGVAARVIQRAWRRARADPAHPICRKRLREEFEEF